MAQYQVDSEQIAQASSCVQGSISTMRDALHGMYTNLQALQNVWRGSAATQFSTAAQQWRAAQQNMEQSLQSIQQSLVRVSNLYAQTESQAAQLFTVH